MKASEVVVPADFSFFKTLAARGGEHPYYQGIALFMAGYVGADTDCVAEHAERALRIWDTMSLSQLEQDMHGYTQKKQVETYVMQTQDPKIALWKICWIRGQQRMSSKARCDLCGEAKPTLKKCDSCRLDWYCSRECQKRAWKLGHKDICRLFNELKIGDFVFIHGLSQRPELNKKMCILRAFDATKGRWGVASDADSAAGVSIKPENLTRVVTVEEVDQIRAEIETAQKR
ncbi:hypothetical protein HDU98_010257 [Podochytrium sp. JEL0797]|nr:hypothetical protein HDU98_010239 [Podochytrium sp. JEL0797]KAJ3076981.1 hypothetical protein HDU98_010257 [Podochytrium sp. JEL0797]